MYEKLIEVIKQSDNIVFFGGAGVSTESDIPDFRSSAGLFSKKTYPYPAEHMISSSFFHEDPKQFYDFYFHEMIFPEAKPNAAHKALAKLEEMGKVKAVITQNIDGLHQLAGSKEVLELHGSVHKNRCTKCKEPASLQEMLKQKEGIPRCTICNGILKPEVVLYGESLDMDIMEKSVSYIANADVLIIGGTSLVVYPAAGLLRYFHGRTLVLINKSETQMDHKADIVIHDAIGNVMEEVMKNL